MICYGYGVKLRALGGGDETQLYVWRNDARIRRWTRQNDELTWERHMAWFKGHQTDPTLKMYGISHDGLVGVCGLTSIDRENQRAEFSLYIGPEHQGHGYGEKALRTLIHHAFYTLNLNCVWGETLDGNPAAALFERVGMVKEGSRRAFYYRDGSFHDAHLFSILRADWSALVSSGARGWGQAPEAADPEGSDGTPGERLRGPAQRGEAGSQSGG